jgi:hypothetical protein
MAQEDFKGTVCPAGHMCRLRTFKREHACDMCDLIISKGTSCKVCDFDLCTSCALPARFTLERVALEEPAATIPIIVESTAALLPPVLPVSEEPTSPGPIDTILVSSTSPPQQRTHPFFEPRRSLLMVVTDDAQPTFHAVPAPLAPSASATDPMDPANAPATFHASQLVAAVSAPIAPLMETDVIPRMSRMKLKKTAAVAALSDPTARAEPATALLADEPQTPQVPASTAIFRSLVSSILVIMGTVDARTRDLLKDELIASFLP